MLMQPVARPQDFSHGSKIVATSIRSKLICKPRLLPRQNPTSSKALKTQNMKSSYIKI
jgi:hypothetical protein